MSTETHVYPRVRRGGALLGSTLATILTMGGAHAAGEPPEPVFDKTSYGDMSFPEGFPDGTSISITQWSHFVPRYDEWF